MAKLRDERQLPIKIKGNISQIDVEDTRELLSRLPEFLVAILENSNTGLIISVEEPGPEDRDKVWSRRSTGGVHLGFYVFSAGKWVSYPTNLGVTYIPGDSRKPPQGYTLIDSGRQDIPANVIDRIKSQYERDPTNTYYMYYAVTGPGFGI